MTSRNRTKVDIIKVAELTDNLFGEAQRTAQTERDNSREALAQSREKVTELIAGGNFDEGMALHEKVSNDVKVAEGKYKAAMAGVDLQALAADYLGTAIALHMTNAQDFEPEPYQILEEAILSMKGYTFSPEKSESGEILIAFNAPPTRNRSGNGSPSRSGEQSLVKVMGANTSKPVTKITVWAPTDAMCDAVGVEHGTERISFPRPGQQSKGLWPIRNFLEFVCPFSDGLLKPDVITSGEGSMYVLSSAESWVSLADPEHAKKTENWFTVQEERDGVQGSRRAVLHKGFRSECTEYDATAIICHLGAGGVTHYNGDTVIFHTEEVGGLVVRDAGGDYIGTRDLGRKTFQGWTNPSVKEEPWEKVWGPVYGIPRVHAPAFAHYANNAPATTEETPATEEVAATDESEANAQAEGI